MLLIPSWVCVQYHTPKRGVKKRMLMAHKPKELKIIKRLLATEDIPLWQLAKQIIPRKAEFDIGQGNELRIAYDFRMFAQIIPEPYIVVWYDDEGLYISQNYLDGAGRSVQYRVDAGACTMSTLRKCLGDWLDDLSHSERFHKYCRNHRSELL